MLFRSVVFNFPVVWDISFVFLLLIFSLIPLWPESRNCIIKNFLSCVLLRQIFILANIACRLEENMTYPIVQWSPLEMPIISSWLMKLFSLTIFLLNFCLLDLLTSERERLKFSTMIVDSSISACGFHQLLPRVVWCSVVICIHIIICYVFMGNWSLYHCVMHFIPENFPCFQVYSDINIATLSFD